MCSWMDWCQQRSRQGVNNVRASAAGGGAHRRPERHRGHLAVVIKTTFAPAQQEATRTAGRSDTAATLHWYAGLVNVCAMSVVALATIASQVLPEDPRRVAASHAASSAAGSAPPPCSAHGCDCTTVQSSLRCFSSAMSSFAAPRLLATAAAGRLASSAAAAAATAGSADVSHGPGASVSRSLQAEAL